MQTVIINRKTWLRGTIDSALRKPNGKKCCIGFLATALGAKNKEITGVDTLRETWNSVCLDFTSKHSALLNQTYEVNDDESIKSDKVREKRIRSIGKAMGIRFRFIN